MSIERVEVEAPGAEHYGKIVLSLACNNRCVFCYDQIERKTYKGMREEEVRRRIDNAAEHGVDVLTLIGGEVTILPYFLRILEYARGRFREIHINTNGRSFHDDSFCRRALEAGLTQIDVSVHGSTPALHDAMVGHAGAFDELTEGLRNLSRLRDAGWRVELSASTIIAAQNHHDLGNIGRLLASLGVRCHRVKYAFEPDGMRVEEAFRSFVPRFSDSMPGVKDLLQLHGERFRVQTHDIPLCLLGEHLECSSDFDGLVVDIYWRDQVERAPRFSRRRTHSKVCGSCELREMCCQPVGGYLAVYGDAELRPYGRASAEALLDGVRRAREANERMKDVGPLMKAGRWQEIRERCAEVLDLVPGHPHALKARHEAELQLMRRFAESLRRRGEAERSAEVLGLIRRAEEVGPVA